MICFLCKAEAVSRCYQCGGLVCAEHDKNNVCMHCSSSIVAGDPRPDRISAQPLPKKAKDGWWRPQQAEEYQPPACYECHALARAVCRNCQSIYCRDHAGSSGLCKACGRSANLGVYIIGSMFLLFLLIFLLSWMCK